MTGKPHGFTLVELLVSASIALTVAAALLAAMSHADGFFSTQLEAADQQQRLRVTGRLLFRDLIMAGAGPDAGADAGSLGRVIAPILPLNRASSGGDLPGTFRPDAITVVYAPSSRAQATLAGPMPAQSGAVAVNIGPGCPLIDAACGFSEATTVLVWDATRAADVFRVEAVQGSVLVLRHTMPDSAKVYAAGSRIVEVVARSYWLRTNAAADTVQLVRDDADGGAIVPVVDHIVGLGFAYFAGPPDSAPLDASNLTDGPWAPDESAPNRFDADLLRIKSIVVSIRVESALASLRGPAGPLFSRGGTSRNANRFLPDLEMRFRVSPRNMGVEP